MRIKVVISEENSEINLIIAQKVSEIQIVSLN